jgi:transcriptional regulator with XRE-family HTH domain
VLSQKTYKLLGQRITQLLQEERERLGLSKYALARRSGVSQQMIGYVEKGQKRPSLETALRLADALDLDLGDLIKKARREVVAAKKSR